VICLSIDTINDLILKLVISCYLLLNISNWWFYFTFRK